MFYNLEGEFIVNPVHWVSAHMQRSLKKRPLAGGGGLGARGLLAPGALEKQKEGGGGITIFLNSGFSH